MLAYIHIPFCDAKCSYCAFNSYTALHKYQTAYMHALKKQLLHDIKRFDIAPHTIQTLFIGGGTPSTIAPKLYAPIFEVLKPYLNKDAQITTEANPNSATKSWLQGMYDLGVNRLSLGTQSFNSQKLALLERAHTAQETIDAVHHAHDIGFRHVSIDLIYGTHIDTQALLASDLNVAFSLPIDHISAYSLTIEEHTKLFDTPSVAHEDEALTKFLFDTIKSKGFVQYEISNFGTHQSVHNKGYWRYMPYLGVGAGAVGRVLNHRYYPYSDVLKYINDPYYIDTETLTSQEIRTEKILLGLRSDVGVATHLVSHTKAAHLQKEGLLTQKGSRLFATNFLLADEIALYLDD